MAAGGATTYVDLEFPGVIVHPGEENMVKQNAMDVSANPTSFFSFPRIPVHRMVPAAC